MQNKQEQQQQNIQAIDKSRVLFCYSIIGWHKLMCSTCSLHTYSRSMADDPEIAFIKQLSVSSIRRDYYASLATGTTRESVKCKCTVCLFPFTADFHKSSRWMTNLHTIQLTYADVTNQPFFWICGSDKMHAWCMASWCTAW